MRLLGSFHQSNGSSAPIRVGIVGFPNVGKSSLINSLKRKMTCQVGANPGVTRSLREVTLDKRIRLVDSPGVVLAKAGSMDPCEMALRNVVRVENVQDPIGVGEAVLRRCSKERLMILYNLPEFGSAEEFFSLLAKRIGRLKKGAVPDRKVAAQRLLRDWNQGKIRYYCQPPDDGSRVLSTELVRTMASEFDIDSINNDEALILDNLPVNLPADAVINLNDDDDDLQMDCDKTDSEKVTIDDGHFLPERLGRKGRKQRNDQLVIDCADGELDGNRRHNYALKKLLKKGKRQIRKTENRCSKLADAIETAMNLNSSHSPAHGDDLQS